jgi:hypothetical protein
MPNRPEPEPLTGDEIRALASIIVYPADSQPVYSADETALALIRLVAGVAAIFAAEDSQLGPSDVAYFVTLGAFYNTHAHGTAVDRFRDEAMRLDINRLILKGAMR